MRWRSRSRGSTRRCRIPDCCRSGISADAGSMSSSFLPPSSGPFHDVVRDHTGGEEETEADEKFQHDRDRRRCVVIMSPSPVDLHPGIVDIRHWMRSSHP